jgi:superfamily II DNA or RNA helicase
MYDQNDVAIVDRSRDSAKLRVAVKGGHQVVTVSWSNSDTKLEVNCSCSKAAEMKHCPHLWAGFLELDRHKAVRTMPTRGNVVLAFVDPPAPPTQTEKPASRPTSTSTSAASRSAGRAAASTPPKTVIGASTTTAALKTTILGAKAAAASGPAATPATSPSGSPTPTSPTPTVLARLPSSPPSSSPSSPSPPSTLPPDARASHAARDAEAASNFIAPDGLARFQAFLNQMRGDSVNASWFVPPAAEWRQRFDRIERYVLNRESGESVRKLGEHRTDLLRLFFLLDLTESMSQCQPVIFFYQRHRPNATANFGPFQPVALDRSALERWEDPADRELLPLLLGTELPYNDPTLDSDYLYNRRLVAGRRIGASLPKMLAAVLLPKLCATGRLLSLLSVRRSELFASARPLTWDADEPYRLSLRIKPDQSGQCWDMRAEARRGDYHFAAHHATVISDGGLAVFGDRIISIDNDESYKLCRAVGFEPIRVPFADGTQFMVECLRYPEVANQLPPELQWEQEELVPDFQVSIALPNVQRGRKPALTIEFQCCYGDSAFRPGHGRAVFASPENRKVFRRNLNQEEEVAAELEMDPDFADSVRPNADESWLYQCDARSLERVTATAFKKGWRVIANGQLVRRSTGVTLSVKSDIDWFELNGRIDFDGESVELPEVLSAIRRGDNHVTLGDGSSGMLPAEWLAKFGPIAELAGRGEEEQGLKFLPSQALLLDSLLASTSADQVGIDERFAEWREKLRSFRGFASQTAPTGFQGSLRAYQEAGLGWMHGLRELGLGGCLADDMGLGKTVQVLALLESRRQAMALSANERLPSLVVAPKSLVFNWAEEAKRFAPSLRVLRFTGNERIFVRDQLQEFDLVLTTYGTLRRDVPILKDIQFDYAILDEAQAIKNASSQSAKSCRLIRARHRLAMTGTPIENHLGELWSLFEFINPGMLGMSSAFQRLAKSARVADTQTPADKEDSGADSAAETAGESGGGGVRSALAQALRPFILRRTKKQVLTELPERTEQTLFCEMETEQRRLYNELKNHYRKSLLNTVKTRGMAKAKIHVLEALLRLRQVACHPALIDERYSEVESAKLEALMEKLHEIIAENHKALVFSQFTSLLSLVRDRLDDEDIRYEYLDGQTSDRQARVERFQNDAELPLFLISLKAGGQGLNLTSADYVFILDPWWNPAVEAQAVDRAYRIGQTRHVFAYRLICRDSIEEKILEMQAAKRAVADAILSEDNSVLRDLTAEDLERLLS